MEINNNSTILLNPIIQSARIMFMARIDPPILYALIKPPAYNKVKYVNLNMTNIILFKVYKICTNVIKIKTNFPLQFLQFH